MNILIIFLLNFILLIASVSSSPVSTPTGSSDGKGNTAQELHTTEHHGLVSLQDHNKIHAAPPHPIKNPRSVIKSWKGRQNGKISRYLARLVFDNVPIEHENPAYSSVVYPYKYEGNAIVYIVDSGVKHDPWLFGDMMGSERWSWAQSHDDKYGHGTACAYLVTLVARKAMIIPVKVDSGKQTHLLAGLDFVLKNCKKHRDQGRPCIVSMSMEVVEPGDPEGGPIDPELLDREADFPSGQTFEDEHKVIQNRMIEAKLRELIKAGIHVVILAGNTGIKKDQRQFNVDGVIIVGGVDEENRVWEYSTQGRRIDIWAPATHITTYLIGTLQRMVARRQSKLLQGTSYSAPLVTGILVLMLDAYGPNFSPVDLKAILLSEGLHGVIKDLDKDAPNNILAHIPPAISGRDEINPRTGRLRDQ